MLKRDRLRTKRKLEQARTWVSEKWGPEDRDDRTACPLTDNLFRNQIRRQVTGLPPPVGGRLTKKLHNGDASISYRLIFC